MKKAFLCLLTLVLLLGLCANAAAAEQLLIGPDTRWDYLDNNTDPAAGDQDRTAWTQPDFALGAGWKQGVGPFGSKRGGATLENGYTAKTVLVGCDDVNDYPAYFFRTEFTLDDPSAYFYLSLTLQQDDGAIVYLNGQRIAAWEDLATDAAGNSLDKPFDANLQYGGATLGTPRTNTLVLKDLSPLRSGSNTLAVEIHQRSADSSDVWFYLPQLTVSDEPLSYPQNDIILNPGADETAMNFTWYMPTDTPGFVQICSLEELVEGRIPADAPKYASVTARTNDGQYSNKVTVTGLQPDTAYSYRLINGQDFTDRRTFRIAPAGDFSFAFSGDPQVGATTAAKDAQLWGNTMNILASSSLFADARFLVSAGDQVNLGDNESYYDAFLQNGIQRSLPVAVTVGNHDNTTFGRGDETKVNAFSQHYNTPNASSEYGVTTAGSDYWFAYNDVLFMVLNVNDLSAAEHRAFMLQAIAAEPDALWRVVVFHHSLYSLASHAFDSDILSLRETLVPVFNELDIDLVLMGHDHVYCRTYIMDGLTPVTDPAAYDDATMTSATDPEGVLFITANSGSGNKTYTMRTNDFPYAAVKNQEHIGNISRVDVTARSLAVTTYRLTDLSVMDTFTIHRTRPGLDLADRIAALTDPTAQQLQQLLEEYEALPAQEQQLVHNYALLTEACEALRLELTGQALASAEAADGFAKTAAQASAEAAAAAEQAAAVDPGNTEAPQLAAAAAAAARLAEAAAAEAAAQAEAAFAADTLPRAETAAGEAAAAEARAAAQAQAAMELLERLQTDLGKAKEQAAQALKDRAGEISPGTREQQQRIGEILAQTLPAIESAVTEAQVSALLADALEALENSACPSEGFRDVPAGAWFHTAVDFVLKNGIMNGDGDDTFDPDEPLTRAMLMQILYNLEGRPAFEGKVSFRDVPRSRWYYAAVTWAAEQGIVTGYDADHFGPEDTLTREQLVTVFWRYAGSPGLKVYKVSFADAAQVSTYAKRAVIWAAEKGVVNGVGGNRFDPQGHTTRAQAAQVIRNFLEKAG